MNRREAKKIAWGQIAALVHVNLANGEGDLFVGIEDLPDHDADLIGEAFTEIQAELWRRGQ